jgi:hypothetical protein
MSAAAPQPPVKLRARRRSQTSIRLAWGAPATEAGRVAGYRVYEAVHGGWQLIGATPARKRSFLRPGLRRDTRHRFAVRSYDAIGSPSAPLLGTFATMP